MRRSAQTLALTAFTLTGLTLTASVLVATSALADAVTTRIETRPYYGAIVTIEQGVRVWRALPPHDRIIIAPEGTKLNVNVESGPRYAPIAPVNNVNIHNSGNSTSGAGATGFAGFGHGGRGAKIIQVGGGVGAVGVPVKMRPTHAPLRAYQPPQPAHAKPAPIKPHH